MNTIHAIETNYAGCYFRSRLEARWAVFFDTLGIEWEYEKQGYVVGTRNPRRYLPDFWLPQTETWVEVKGSDAAVDWDFLADACDWNSALPGLANSLDTNRGLLLLGPIPAGALRHPWRHIGIQHHKGLVARYFYFSGLAGLMPAEYPIEPGIGAEGEGWGWHWWQPGMSCNCCPPPLEGVPYRNPHVPLEQPVADAYAAARSARFEHGQSGASQ